MRRGTPWRTRGVTIARERRVDDGTVGIGARERRVFDVHRVRRARASGARRARRVIAVGVFVAAEAPELARVTLTLSTLTARQGGGDECKRW